MKVWIITLFPEYFKPLKECGVVGQRLQGRRGDKIDLDCVDPRQFVPKNYKSVDDYPFGGGPGMVMRADFLEKALVEGVFQGRSAEDFLVIYPSPQGRVWKAREAQTLAQSLTQEKELVFLCGRYEGVDQRFIETYVDLEFSLGDFILSGGEIATLAMLDSALRYMPETLGNQQSPLEESFQAGLLEAPQYTRPRVFHGQEVPEVLLSGHHKKINDFKKQEGLKVTQERRPDLLL